MLTAKVSDTDKIAGLTMGADDYVTKPFNPLELMARVKTQLRRFKRYNQEAPAALLFGSETYYARRSRYGTITLLLPDCKPGYRKPGYRNNKK